MSLFSKYCHPERSSCFAKRISYGVEGPPAIVHNERRGKVFSRCGHTLGTDLELKSNGSEAVYIVASNSGTLYIGVTGKIEGFSSQYKCNRLVYFESFDIVQKAIGREKQLKGWRRSKKVALIESMNPRWEDLAEKWGSEMAFAGQAITGR